MDNLTLLCRNRPLSEISDYLVMHPKERRLALYAACATGRIDLFQHLISNPELAVFLDDAFMEACTYSQIKLAEYIMNNHTVDILKPIEKAVRQGIIKTLEWFAGFLPLNDVRRMFLQACECGVFKSVEFLSQFDVDHEAGFKIATINGEISIVKFLDNEKFNHHEAFRLACMHGRVCIVVWITEKYPLLDIHYQSDAPFILACERNHLDVIERLIELSQCTESTLVYIDGVSYVMNPQYEQVGRMILTEINGIRIYSNQKPDLTRLEQKMKRAKSAYSSMARVLKVESE